MAGGRKMAFCGVFVTTVLAVMLLPAGESIQEKAAAAASHRRLIRNRRNISWYKQHSDFWNWYKYFTDAGNQEAVQEMDRIYLAYLQNKNRAEGRRSYKSYLRHLGDVYKSCAESDDSDCVASYTSRTKANPEPPKPAPMKTCDPTKDAYCLYTALVMGKSPYLPLVLPASTPAPTPVKATSHYTRSPVPEKAAHSGHYYNSPSTVPFLTKEQKAELLRICSADDVECLQYHLKAAYGYAAPSTGALPSYAHLGCDPMKDPYCQHKMAQKGPSALSTQYPSCDPLRDPYCSHTASPGALRALATTGSCNPLFDEGCNPLTATRYANSPASYQSEERDKAAAIRAPPPAAEQYNDPYAMFRDPYANANRVNDPYAMYRQASAPSNDLYATLRQYIAKSQTRDPYSARMDSTPEANPNDPYSVLHQASAMHHRSPPTSGQQYTFSHSSYDDPPQEERHSLGPPGKTKEGYDCFIGYDQQCYPVKPSEPRSGSNRRIPYPAIASEPHLNADARRDGVIEPSNPHCDPEYDRDCRLRRYESEEAHTEAQVERSREDEHSQEDSDSEQYEAEPFQSGQEEPRMPYPPHSQGMPSLQDILRHYSDQYPEQDDHRSYADDYRNK
ncbi:actinodin1 [Thalassophryne amazonica]|uniref:actinodin1 n=1 Tax=Thalassophryne amazonica TaxID=390379 RepID=UPI00147110A9|nr:actinodin1 [Thalassophryne amazonica]